MSVPSIAMEDTPRRYRLTVDQYHRMGEIGIIPEDARLELLDGQIVRMTPAGSRHAACVRRVGRELARLGDRATVSIQSPVALSDASEPEPDVSLLRPRPDDHAGAHPGPADVLLLVEVADATIRIDREVKGGLYALSGIPEYWIVDLAADAIEIRVRPEGELWGHTRRVHRGEQVAPAAFPEHRIPVDEILPPTESSS